MSVDSKNKILKKRSSVLNYEALISPIVEKDEPLFPTTNVENSVDASDTDHFHQHSHSPKHNNTEERSHNHNDEHSNSHVDSHSHSHVDSHSRNYSKDDKNHLQSSFDIANNMPISSLESGKRKKNSVFSSNGQENTDLEFPSSFTFGGSPSEIPSFRSHEHSHEPSHSHSHDHEHHHSHELNHSHNHDHEHQHSHECSHESSSNNDDVHYHAQSPLKNVLYYFFPFMKGDDTPRSITNSFQSSEILLSIVQLYTSPETNRIFQFLVLNFTFMFVQMIYSFRSKSLGLFSDSLHMLLDCSSLAIGLFAKLISKRVKSSFYSVEGSSKSTAIDAKLISKYPFGLARIETLAAFVNGILLLSIVQDIFFESVHRLMNPVQLENINELLVVSILGLIVNLVGIFALNHGHDDSEAHSHAHSHVCSHETDHSDYHYSSECSHTPSIQALNSINDDDSLDASTEKSATSHSSASDNDHGIFLHVLADTLGSAGVIVSTLLLKFFPSFKILDPISSLFIILLILLSCIPFLKSSFVNLLLVLPEASSSRIKTKYNSYKDHESLVRDLLNDLFEVEGIVDVTNVKVWKDEVASSSGCNSGHSHSHNHSHDSLGSSEEEDGKTHLIGFVHLTYADGENSTILKKRCEKIILDLYGIDLFIQLDNDSWKL